MNFETIILEKKDGVARITFNRPQVLNAFNPQMSDELKALVKDIAADKEVRVVVFSGAGDRAFMAGAVACAVDDHYLDLFVRSYVLDRSFKLVGHLGIEGI